MTAVRVKGDGVSIPRSGLGLFRLKRMIRPFQVQSVSIPRSGLGLFRLTRLSNRHGVISPSFNPSFGFRPIQTAV